jgi:acyl-coenzyme A synthetase/AMP-(fatty) acid ligase
VPPGVSARILEDVGDRLSGLRIVARGEEMSPALARRLLAAGCLLHGVYGGAETTGWAMSGRIDGGTGLTSGRPIANMRALVVAPDGRELPIGVRGELCIAGTGIALGHQDDPRFRRSVHHGRHYRTGELARWRPDGTVERLGQIRRQAFIAGSRVSLSEVDAVLLDQHGVDAAVALIVKSPTGGDILVAFAEVSGEAVPADRLAERLREHALVSLPPAAVPQRVICVDALPRAADGHVDHDALALLTLERLNDGPDRQGAPYFLANT